MQPVAELPADADDHPLRPVPAARVVEERLARRAADGLLAADDVPAERLVAVEERLVDAADEVARRVEVHVHLLDDHALLALDLLGVEARVAEHVDEHVERRVAGLGGAADVVARVLLAREGVELAADRVDLAGDVARSRPPLGSLEEHVLGEVRDPVRLCRLVARAGGEHDEARDRLGVRHRRGQDAQAVRQREALEDPHPGHGIEAAVAGEKMRKAVAAQPDWLRRCRRAGGCPRAASLPSGCGTSFHAAQTIGQRGRRARVRARAARR